MIKNFKILISLILFLVSSLSCSNMGQDSSSVDDEIPIVTIVEPVESVTIGRIDFEVSGSVDDL